MDEIQKELWRRGGTADNPEGQREDTRQVKKGLVCTAFTATKCVVLYTSFDHTSGIFRVHTNPLLKKKEREKRQKEKERNKRKKEEGGGGG